MVVLITGSSRGIGAATAKIFAQHGYRTAINYNSSREKALCLKNDLLQSGADAEIFRADVSDSAQATALIEQVKAHFGSVDVLVNNAGVAQFSLFQDTDDNEYNRLADVNFRGAFNCSRAVLPDMIAKHSGSIVNVSSVLGVTGASCEVVYSATKAAIIGMTAALAKETGPSGIRVNCVAPGVIDTDMNSCHDEKTLTELCESTALCRIGTADEVAKAIYFLAGDDASFITGQTLRIDGGLTI